MTANKLAQKIAAESIVLLKNEQNVLPLKKGTRIAFFGRAQLDTIISGNGSGAAHAGSTVSILAACENAGLIPEPALKDHYQKQLAQEPKADWEVIDWSQMGDVVNSGLAYEVFGRYHAPKEEPAVPAALLESACAATDTAIWVIGRCSGGEECDRHPDEDFYLTPSEKALAAQVCGSFENVILVLNSNGLIDLAWIEDQPAVKSILFAGVPGEAGAAALAQILTGEVNPSGKLPVTIAKQYSDYPAAAHFSWEKDDPEKLLTYESYGLDAGQNGSTGFARSPVTVYREDLFLGYRYFDTFGMEPLFPFGYGLSYTTFDIAVLDTQKDADGLTITVSVLNTGERAGREVVQAYLETCAVQNRPRQELKAFRKTALLAPGEEQTLTLRLPWRLWAHYREPAAAWIIESGTYLIRVGNSSRHTLPAAHLFVPQDILIEQCENRLGLRACNRGKIDWLSASGQGWTLPVCPQRIVIEPEDVTVPPQTRETVPDEIMQKVKALSTEQLAALCVGYGPGIPFAAFSKEKLPETILDADGNPVTVNDHPTGFNGYVSPAIPQQEIHSVFYKDGPAGIGETAWPSEMLIACAFDEELWYAFGDAVGRECEKQKVNVWLAPAMNLHRHPLGGRNFEYFSEDPILTGLCACAITKGVQENHPVLVCPKHFAVNEQETFRRGSTKKNYDAADSILREQTAREVYLKPFEMLVRETGVACLMTSFNKINGTFAGGNAGLCTHILREEWGYAGVVVTDWGDLDTVVDGADAVAAGNDVVMPGGPPVIAQILAGYEQGRVTRGQLEKAAAHLLMMLSRCGAAKADKCGERCGAEQESRSSTKQEPWSSTKQESSCSAKPKDGCGAERRSTK